MTTPFTDDVRLAGFAGRWQIGDSIQAIQVKTIQSMRRGVNAG